jgi:predicted SAM-dependent methyltransferase
MPSDLLTRPLRLDLGSGYFPAFGFTSVDNHQNADHRVDILTAVFTDVAEVRMSHVLEHFPWRETVPLLQRIRGWMNDGGRITVEVPDMARIMAGWQTNPDWIRYVYGSQEHDGEYHRTGFTRVSLLHMMSRAGWLDVAIREFRSEFRTRPGMPCLEAKATA